MNYWVVGATWKDENLANDFYKRGYWEIGYDDVNKPKFAERRDKIKDNDRIAIKAMDGKGANTISIEAIGIVKDINDRKVFIDWKLKGIKERHVHCKNYFGTIHKVTDDIWRNEAFRL
jgi:hypothetical protein